MSNLHMLHSARLPGQTTDDVHAEREYYRGLNHKDLVIQLSRRGISYSYILNLPMLCTEIIHMLWRNFDFTIRS